MSCSSIVEIEAVLTAYIDGLYHADPHRLAQVFHPQAVYATADEATPLILDVPAYLDVVRQRVPPSACGEDPTFATEAIHLAGQNTASVRLRCSLNGRNYIDFLSLIKVEGKWLIISKVFHFTET